MLDDLIALGIKHDTIDKLYDNESLAYNLWCNIDDLRNIIEYLKSINIEKIDELLIYKPDMFMETKDDIEKLFQKKNISEIVAIINTDYMNIDMLFE